MVCYYHPSEPAVGICKNCHKGICAVCAVDVRNGLACKNCCEGEVALINDIFEHNKVQMLRLGSLYNRNALWFVGLGIMLLLVAVVILAVEPGMLLAMSPLVILAVFLLVSAAMNRAEGQKHKRSKPH